MTKLRRLRSERMIRCGDCRYWAQSLGAVDVGVCQLARALNVLQGVPRDAYTVPAARHGGLPCTTYAIMHWQHGCWAGDIRDDKPVAL